MRPALPKRQTRNNNEEERRRRKRKKKKKENCRPRSLMNTVSTKY
jgi:hypothetical protein